MIPLEFSRKERDEYADMVVFAVGLAVMVGQVPAMWNVLGSDAIIHLCKLLCYLIGKLIVAATDGMQSGRNPCLLESDSADHDLGLYVERSTCFRDDAGLSFCNE